MYQPGFAAARSAGPKKPPWVQAPVVLLRLLGVQAKRVSVPPAAGSLVLRPLPPASIGENGRHQWFGSAAPREALLMILRQPAPDKPSVLSQIHVPGLSTSFGSFRLPVVLRNWLTSA